MSNFINFDVQGSSQSQPQEPEPEREEDKNDNDMRTIVSVPLHEQVGEVETRGKSPEESRKEMLVEVFFCT